MISLALSYLLFCHLSNVWKDLMVLLRPDNLKSLNCFEGFEGLRRITFYFLCTSSDSGIGLNICTDNTCPLSLLGEIVGIGWIGHPPVSGQNQLEFIALFSFHLNDPFVNVKFCKPNVPWHQRWNLLKQSFREYTNEWISELNIGRDTTDPV